VDLGSSRIKAATAEAADGKLTVLGVVSLPSAGIKKGNIVDIESAALAIEQALLKLEKLSGQEIHHATVGFSGVGIETIRNVTSITVGQDRKIRGEDRNRALFSAQSILIPPDRTVFQILENKYRIDGNDGIKDPVGMAGQRLELDALLILANASARVNLLQSLEQVELSLDMVYNPVLQAESTLTPAEKDAGVVLVDMGAAITEVSIFQSGAMIRSVVLPLGADYITRDLSIVLKISLAEAQKLKENGRFLEPREKDFVCWIKNLQGKDESLSGGLVRQVIMSRVDEIAQMIWQEISAYAAPGYLPGGVVLTGGGAKLADLIGYYQRLFGVPVRLGESCMLEESAPTGYDQTEFTAVLGNLAFQSAHGDYPYAEHKIGLRVDRIVKRIHAWVREILS
jgi:cell division protein FtsA